MSPRDTQASLAAGYQLMASYLVWDLRDLLDEGSLSRPDARERLHQFVEMLQAAQRAMQPVYPARAEQSRSGSARAERGKRLATLNQDEQLFEMVLAARGDGDLHDAGASPQRACIVLEAIEDRNWP